MFNIIRNDTGDVVTLYRDSPSIVHACRVARDLSAQLPEQRAYQVFRVGAEPWDFLAIYRRGQLMYATPEVEEALSGVTRVREKMTAWHQRMRFPGVFDQERE